MRALGFGFLLGGSGGTGFAAGSPFDFGFGEHGSAALGGSAVACAVGGVGVVEVVLVGEFFAGLDGAEGDDEDPLVFFEGFAVGGAGVVDEHGGAEAVDDGAFGAEGEEVGDDAVLVAEVGFGFGQAGAIVLADAGAFRDGARGVAAGGVDGGGADDEVWEHGGGGWARVYQRRVEVVWGGGWGCGVGCVGGFVQLGGEGLAVDWEGDGDEGSGPVGRSGFSSGGDVCLGGGVWLGAGGAGSGGSGSEAVCGDGWEGGWELRGGCWEGCGGEGWGGDAQG